MSIVIKTVSDSKQAQADLAKLRESVDGIKNSADQVSGAIANFTKVIGAGLAAFGAFKAFTQYSDELTNLESKLRLVTKSQEEMSSAFRNIQRIAVSTRTDLNTVAGLYTRIANSATRFGASQADIARFSETVSKAIATSGASMQESQAAIQQLGQALASGRLQGDELRSILENAPPLAMAIADGLGVSIGKMRMLGEAGQLTNVKVFKALLKQQDKINANFDKMGVTYGGAFTNLSNALIILFSKVKEEVVGSSSTLASGINEFAKSIINFANDFKLNMALARASVLLFVLDAVNLFDEFYVEVEKSASAVSQMAQDMYTEWKPVMVALIGDLMVWSQTAMQAAASVTKSMYESFKSTEFGKQIIDGISYVFQIISQKLTTIFEHINSNLPTIDVRKVFPGLDTALEYVKGWALQVEQWFYWIYDRVIGHSWIPDLVIGTGVWLKKLLGGPLGSVLEFVKTANNAFKGLEIASIFGAAVTAVSKLRGVLFPILGIVTAIGAGLAAFGMFKSGSLKVDVNGLDGKSKFDLNLGKVESLLGDAVKWLKDTYAQIKSSVNTSTTMRTLKQIFGIQDTTPGSIFGQTVDTNAQVGRGPHRNEQTRPVGHDIINALPSNWQIPFVAAFTGVLALAIVNATQAGTTRAVLLSVLTSAAGIAISQSVHDSQIKETFSGAAFGMLNILEKGLSALFGGNILRDPLGFLSLLTKTALLFKAGREMLLGAAVAMAKAPTNMVQTLFTAGEAKLADTKSKALTKEISSLPKNLNDAFKKNNDAYERSIRRLASGFDQGGNQIGDARARAAVTSGTTTAFGVANIDRVAEAARHLSQATKSQEQLNNIKIIRSDMVKQRDDLSKKAEDLGKQVTEAKAAFTQGIKNFGAGVGGVLGGFAGFQIGVEMARGMTDSPGWSRVGVIIASTLGVQAIGSAIGLAISSILLGTATRIGALFVAGFMALNPFVAGAAVIGASLYLGYQLFTRLPDEWKKALGMQTKGEASTIQAAIPVAEQQIKIAKSQEDVTKALDGLAATIRENGGNRALAPGADAYTMGTSLDVFQREALKAKLNEPTPAERAANLKTNQDLIEASKKLNETFGKVVEWLIGPKDVQKKAGGGFIRGPGSGTSDSIPAMLSNGEFVVNARDARKNWDVLTAINSGAGISRFAGGTETASVPAGAKTVPVVVQNAKEITAASDKTLSELFAEGYKFISEAITKGISNLDPAKTLGVGAPSGGTGGGGGGRLSLQQQMENMKTMDQSMGLMQKQLEKSGFKDVSVSGLKSLSASTMSSVTEALDKIAELREKGAKRPEGSFLRKQVDESINELNRQIVSSLANAGADFKAPSNLKEPKREYKPTEIFVKDQLEIMNKAFKELELTAEEFYNIPDRLRESVFAKAHEIEKQSALIDREYIGLLEEGKTIPQEFFAKRQAIEKQRKEFQGQVLGELNQVRTPFASIKGQLASIGVNIGEDYFNALTDIERSTVEELVIAAKATQEILKKPAGEVPQDIRTAAQEQFSGTVNLINEKLGEGAKVGLTKAGKLRFDLNKYNVSMDDFTYNLMSDLERTTVETYLAAMKEAKDKLAANPNMSESERKRLQTLINDSTEEVGKITARNAPGYKSPGKMAGEAFASSLNDGFTSAVTNAIKGQSDENKSVLRTLMDSMLSTISNTVIDTFVKGLLNPLTGENGLLTSMFKNMGSKIFSLGGSDSGVSSAATAAASSSATANAESTGILSSIWSSLTAGFASLMGFFGIQTANDTLKLTQSQLEMTYYGTILGNILLEIGYSTAMIIAAIAEAAGVIAMSNAGGFFASGGPVSGAGTSTSDSIPAMLSNGEFVINAKATKENFKLLTAINNGKRLKLADGGFATTMINAPAISSVQPVGNNANNKPTQQVFQINITGDVSKQTRAEIQRMIPNIAYGVSSYNREKG